MAPASSFAKGTEGTLQKDVQNDTATRYGRANLIDRIFSKDHNPIAAA